MSFFSIYLYHFPTVSHTHTLSSAQKVVNHALCMEKIWWPEIIAEWERKGERGRRKRKQDVCQNAENEAEYRKLTILRLWVKRKMEKVLTVIIFSNI